MPFHQSCLLLFAKALEFEMTGKCSAGRTWKDTVDTDVLYATVSKLHKSCQRVLSLEYGELDEMKSVQYWRNQPGHEVNFDPLNRSSPLEGNDGLGGGADMSQAWVSNPFSSPQISSFFSTLQDDTISLPPSKALPIPTSPTQNFTPFSKLAKEVTCEILLYISHGDLRGFALSGLLPFAISTMPSFWHRKLRVDMPFLWDFPVCEPPRDWFQIYHELRRHCFATTPETEHDEADVLRVVGGRDESLVLGLANRRRVWETCSQLAELYVEEMPEEGAGGKLVVREILEGSVSLGMPIVAAPVEKGAKYISGYLVSEWDDLDRDLELTFHFERGPAGRLCGIERVGKGVLGERGEGVSVLVAKGAYVRGFELNVEGAGEIGEKDRVGITGVKVNNTLLFR